MKLKPEFKFKLKHRRREAAGNNLPVKKLNFQVELQVDPSRFELNEFVGRPDPGCRGRCAAAPGQP